MAKADDMDLSEGNRDTRAVVKYYHALGTRTAPGRTLEHLNDDTLLYLTGKHLAVFQHESATHRFILKNVKTAQVVCFCVSPNRKYVALAERLTDGPLQVNIYTQQTGSKVRSLEFKYLSKQPVVCMGFSTDNKHLVTVTATPDAFIYMWQVDKSRLVGMIDANVDITKVSISPWQYSWLCTTGPSTLKLWKLQEKQLKGVDVLARPRKDGAASSQQAGYRFTCHAWYDDEKFVAGTEEGALLIIEGGDLKRTISAVNGEGMAITSIQALARGLICGGDGGIITVFERAYDNNLIFAAERKELTPGPVARVVDISVSPKEDNAVVVFDNNTTCLLQLENIDNIKKDDPSSYSQMLSVGFHSAEVTAVDVCTQKPLIVTGSTDKTVRVWNFLRRRVEFIKTFDDEITCLALHPTGLRLIVGFKSCIRMYNVLSNDLHLCTEFAIKPCSEIRFSHGGHAFAAVVALRVVVINTYDFQYVSELRGPTGTIRSLCWSKNDQKITTADIQGAVFTFVVDGAIREDNDEVRKHIAYNCVRTDETHSMTAALGTCRIANGTMGEGELSIYCMIHGAPEAREVRLNLTAQKLPTQRKQHTCELAIAHQSQTLFVGGPNGCLLMYHWPMQEESTPYNTVEVHNGEILYVLLTIDERYLFTVGDDNSMYMFEVDAMVDGKPATTKPFNFAAFEDVCYVYQSDIDEKNRKISELKQRVDDLRVSMQRQEAETKQKYEADKAIRGEEAASKRQFLERQLEQVKRQKEEAEAALQENSRHWEAQHLKTAEQLEIVYSKKSEEATARYNHLQTQRDDLVVRFENEIATLSREHDAEVSRLKQTAKETESKLNLEIETLQRKMAEKVREADGMLDATIVDYEEIIDSVTAKYKAELTKTEEDLSKAINNSSTGERDSDRLKQERDNLQQTLNKREEEIADLEAVVERKKKENDSLRKEMYVRFESISTAEKKIQQLKKQTTELEKLRYVLTFKFNELKKEVAPKDKQISYMTARIEEMDRELEDVVTDREQLKQALERKDDKLLVLQREIGGQGKHLEDKERVISTMLKDLSELVASPDDKRLVYKLKDVVMKYANKSKREQNTVEEDRTAEFERQREYMESQLSCVRRQNKQKEKNLRQENQRSTGENATLVKEINDLRHEKKQLITKCAMVETQLKEARLALQRATSATPAQSGSTPQPPSGLPQLMSADTPNSDLNSVARRGPPGRLVRGPTRALRDIAQLDADKIGKIIAQVERNNVEMERQQEEIERLRDFVGHLLSKAETEHAGRLSEEDVARHDEIRRHLEQLGGSPVAAEAKQAAEEEQ